MVYVVFVYCITSFQTGQVYRRVAENVDKLDSKRQGQIEKTSIFFVTIKPIKTGHFLAEENRRCLSPITS